MKQFLRLFLNLSAGRPTGALGQRIVEYFLMTNAKFDSVGRFLGQFYAGCSSRGSLALLLVCGLATASFAGHGNSLMHNECVG